MHSIEARAEQFLAISQLYRRLDAFRLGEVLMKARGCVLAAAMILAGTGVGARAETQVERGRYLVAIMDCGGCHTNGALLGKPDPAQYLAGADIGWGIPGLGVVYPRNITPDK